MKASTKAIRFLESLSIPEGAQEAHDRSEGLAHAMRDRLGVVDRGEDGGEEKGPRGQHQPCGERRRQQRRLGRYEGQRGERREHGPERRVSRRGRHGLPRISRRAGR